MSMIFLDYNFGLDCRYFAGRGATRLCLHGIKASQYINTLAHGK